jgi:para-nitrobenzyl esterase
LASRAAANAGLLDAELAIDWVHRHIGAFGGDAEAITVMGQSAGSTMACALLARKPRFSRAILQSAALGRGWRSAAQGRAMAIAFYVACGVSTLEEARALPVETLLQAQVHPAMLEALATEGRGLSMFAPVADGEVLPLNMDVALERAVRRADVLVSYTRDEMAAFPGEGRDTGSAARGEVLFGAPARAWARAAGKAGRRSWLARFDVGPSKRFGACHCVELPFTFGNLDSFAGAPMLQGLPRAQAEALSSRVRAAWIAFIRGQDPGWPQAPFAQLLG